LWPEVLVDQLDDERYTRSRFIDGVEAASRVSDARGAAGALSIGTEFEPLRSGAIAQWRDAGRELKR